MVEYQSILREDIKMEEKLIALAHSICKAKFMDYPDYDEDIELGLADALTILVQENVGHDEDIESAELYDFITEKIG
jgi:hypothetical protein